MGPADTRGGMLINRGGVVELSIPFVLLAKYYVKFDPSSTSITRYHLVVVFLLAREILSLPMYSKWLFEQANSDIYWVCGYADAIAMERRFFCVFFFSLFLFVILG